MKNRDWPIEKRKEYILKMFKSFDNWEDKYTQLIAFGKKLDPMDESQKTDDILVRGCVSRVWLICEELEDGKLAFLADSDAAITKGLIAILVYVYSHCVPDDIISHPPTFLEEVGIIEHLSMNRSNGLVNMVKTIKEFAESKKC